MNIEKIIGMMVHQEVWNSFDEKWVHPTYCITCRNIQRITKGVDPAAPTWLDEISEMRKDWPE